MVDHWAETLERAGRDWARTVVAAWRAAASKAELKVAGREGVESVVAVVAAVSSRAAVQAEAAEAWVRAARWEGFLAVVVAMVKAGVMMAVVVG